MQNAKAIKLACIQFEKMVSSLFESYGFETTIQSGEHGAFGLCYPFDILAKKSETNYIIEAKFSRTNSVSALRLTETAAKLSAFISSDQCHLQKCVPVLVIGATIKPELRQKIQKYSVFVIDIQNLLFLVNDNDDLKSELLSILEYSVNDILPEKPDIDIFEINNALPACKKNKKDVKPKAEFLLEHISQWVVTGENAKRRSPVYEELCHDILKYLFDDELSLWHKQQKSNDDLYRFDLICKIKDGNVSGLWTTILQCFNTKYVIFEFKNYAEPITQKEVYTTDKYLYLKALRGVAIIVSCKGASPNANKAIRGTLRENGKLILSLDNSDLCEMIRIKMDEGTPADYLYSKFDNLLIDLEK